MESTKMLQLIKEFLQDCDTKDQFHSYTCTMNNPKIKKIASKRVKYLGIGLTKEVQAYTLKSIKHCSKKLKKA